ncbi:MAG: Eco57I restriction-modification methylase domain-containing protein [Bacteroidales bacterium]|nr:Eco57I restriction-modification methylase domain-containing protein [Bacteroidales bacterium]
MNPETLRKIFKSPFDYKTYSNEIVHRLFGCNDVATNPELLDTNSDGDKSYFIGQMEDADGRLLGFFYTRVADGGDVRRKRVGLRKLIQPYLKYDVDGAIAVFDDGNHWRLSYICDLKEGNTAAKRFSYILGDEQGQYKTPLERLGKMAEKNGRFKLSDLREAFSVDALSKEFFDEYHRHYDIIINELKRQGFDGVTIHDYVKKMMGRIVFLHFLQKKGWLKGNLAFLRDLFFFSPHQGDFLEQVLEPLFFGIFNTENANREQLFKAKGWDMGLLDDWKELPYLNGGLFERDAVDEQNITLPASLFEDLFTFMASYNFTVDENDPDDAEVGVDPEMLGKIFESLLEDNKAKGAFYTPKEIVRYMCKESLIAYLGTRTSSSANGLEAHIRTFVETHEMQPELEPYREALDAALREVKICDPAIGSGAFPMGLLNELWRCREAIEETSSRVELKKEIIENNIYGVDIEKGAIDIARLRFWLSIVVDAEEPEPLPNFDYKFMQGNSLIESYNGFDLSRISSKLRGGQSKSMQLVLGIDSHTSRQNLQRLLREYFSVTDHKQKSSMRQAINEEVKTLIRESIGGTPASLAKLEKMDCSANQDFFLWHTWFKDIFDNGGFDIVIGNPPYVNVKNGIPDYVKQTYKQKYKTAIGQFDLFTLFIEQGLFMSKKGVLSLIVPKPIINNENYTFARQLLLERGLSDIVIGSNIFENAGVESCILISTSSSVYHVSEVDANRNVIKRCSIPLNVAIKLPFSMISTELSEEKLDVIDKIMNIKHKLLGDIVDVTRGIECGKTDKCIILTPNRYKLLRGQDCVRYSVVPTNLFCEYDSRNTSKFKPLNIYFGTKLLIRRVASELISTVDSDNHLCLNTVYCGKIIDKDYTYPYMCALLNSSLINYWFRNIFVLTDKLFPYIRKSQLDYIPIAKASIEVQTQIGDVVNQIIYQKQSSPLADTSKLENEINQLVYQLYNLTPEEIAIIENRR